jgi:hypothetical protein
MSRHLDNNSKMFSNVLSITIDPYYTTKLTKKCTSDFFLILLMYYQSLKNINLVLTFNTVKIFTKEVNYIFALQAYREP